MTIWEHRRALKQVRFRHTELPVFELVSLDQVHLAAEAIRAQRPRNSRNNNFLTFCILYRQQLIAMTVSACTEP